MEQPPSQSAGYEEEQLNPPTSGLDVSVTVIAAPLGLSSLGIKTSRVKRGGCQRGQRWLKCAERARKGGGGWEPGPANLCFTVKPNKEMFDTNKTYWEAKLPSLPLSDPPLF